MVFIGFYYRPTHSIKMMIFFRLNNNFDNNNQVWNSKFSLKIILTRFDKIMLFSILINLNAYLSQSTYLKSLEYYSAEQS